MVGKSYAVSFTQNGINYVANADTAIIKGYNEIPEDGELNLAASVEYGGKTYTVTTIQSSAFLSCTDITKLTIPASIKYIQSSAFGNCLNMTSIVISEGDDVLDADNSAFKNCGIEDATIGRTLKTSIFSKNKTLKKVEITGNINTITPLSFYGCEKLSQIQISGKVTSIGASAFENCRSITQLTLPQSVTSIKSNAFAGCSNLSDINLDYIETIEDGAFASCKNLQKVNFKKIKQISGFRNTSLKNVTLPSSLRKMGKSCFLNCSLLDSVTIEGEVEDIPESCFSDCKNLSSVQMPSSVRTISREAFAGCSKLKTISWGNITSISTFAFENSGIEELDFPSTLKHIAHGVFYGCKNLKKVDLSKTSISEVDGFSGCTSLEEVIFSTNSKSISPSAFSGATSLKEVDLSKTKINFLNSFCFGNCTSLESIKLSELTDTICESAFSGCKNLTTIANTDNVKMVYSNAFEHTKLFNDIAENSPIIIGSVIYSHKGSIEDKKFVVPTGITCICDSAFKNQDIQTIKLNEELKYVGKGAFDGCKNLVSLTIPASVEIFKESAGCSMLSSLTIKASEHILQLGELGGAEIKKLYLGRDLETSNWFPNVENVTIGKDVSKLYHKIGQNDKIKELYFEDCTEALNIGRINVNNVSSLYFGRPLVLNTGYTTNNFQHVQDLTIGEYVTKIPDNFINDNSVIQEIEIPANVKEVGMSSFYNLTNVTKLTLHEGLEKVNNDGFSLRNSVPLDTLRIPNTIKELAALAFADIKCKKLILDGVTRLGYMAFASLDIDSIIIPSSVKLSTETFAFSNVKYVDASQYKGQLNSSFESCGKLEKILLPKEGMTVLSENEFWDCGSLKEIEIPNTIDSIGHSVFGYSQIRKVHIPASVRIVENRMFCYDETRDTLPKPIVFIDGGENCTAIKLHNTFEVDLQKLDVGKDFSYDFSDGCFSGPTAIKMDSLIIRDVKKLNFIAAGTDRKFSPSTAICLSSHLTSCNLWKPDDGKIFVLPGSKLPKDDITYMYTVNKLNYEYTEGNDIIFDGIDNMSFEITPVFYQEDKEVELNEPGQYDLSMKISGTSFDGIYPTGLQVKVTNTSNINNATIDKENNCPTYNLSGQRVGNNYKGIVIQNGKKRIAL
jgi:Leucine-rich repeat (LRR) protein